MDTWNAVEADRVAFAGYLAALSPQDWDAASWCDGWSVKNVVAHTLVIPTMPKGKVFSEFLKAGFNLNKMNAKLVKQLTTSISTAEMIAKTRDTAGVRSAPPGLKPVGVFAEMMVHASDIALAIGKPFDLPVEHYVAGLDHMKDVQPALGCKKRIAGLTLRATDTDWSTGSGPLVEGNAKHLLSAMTGRRQALGALSGDGVGTMKLRP
jgi:uncharacterized protein (TIGR03083 family)